MRARGTRSLLWKCVSQKCQISFFSISEQHPIVHIYPIFSSRPSVKVPLICFHLLAVVNSASINTAEHVSAEQEAQRFHIPMSSIAVSYSMFIFSFLRILCNDFHSGCTSLQSHLISSERWVAFPTPPAFFVGCLVDVWHLNWGKIKI